MNRPELGQKCIIKGKSWKRQVSTTQNWYPRKTKWFSKSTDPIEAVYIGWRTVYEGITEHARNPEDWYPPNFHREGAFEKWLFVTSERSAPIFVDPSHVEFEAKESVA